METEDVVPSRLKKARHLIKSLVDQLRGDRVGLVAFAASSYVACPLTTDTDYVLESLQILGPRMIASREPTSASASIPRARRWTAAPRRWAATLLPAGLATRRGRPQGVARDRADLGRRGPGGGRARLREGARESGIKLYVIGLGTEKGAPVPVRDDMGNLVGHKHARNGEVVISRFRPDALMKVAEAGRGPLLERDA